MKSFKNIDEMFFAACKFIELYGHDIPSRDGHSREVMGYCARLGDPRANFLVNPVRKLNPSYAAAEFLWYLSGENKIEMIQSYAPQYTRFTEDGKTAWGAYGYRWGNDPSFVKELIKHNDNLKLNFSVDKFLGDEKLQAPINQLQAVTWLLKKNPNTRQAVISMWNPGDLVHALLGDKKDIPCTTSLNFLIRKNKLYLTTTIRSNDVWLGFPYDVWCFTNLQILIADILGLELGWYQHQAMSLHVYDRNLKKFNEARKSSIPKFCPIFYYQNISGPAYSEMLNTILDLERSMVKEKRYQNIPLLSSHTLLGQCFAMMGLKWDYDNAISHIDNHDLREFCRRE